MGKTKAECREEEFKRDKTAGRPGRIQRRQERGRAGSRHRRKPGRRGAGKGGRTGAIEIHRSIRNSGRRHEGAGKR